MTSIVMLVARSIAIRAIAMSVAAVTVVFVNKKDTVHAYTQ